MALLSIRDLSVEYSTERGPLRAVDTVSLEMDEGQTLGLAGESGCGKSTLAFSILRLLPRSAKVSGRIQLDGEDVLQMDDRALRAYRWKSVALVPQGSMNAFDPVRTIGSQIVEGIKAHESTSDTEAWERARALLASVGIPKNRAKNYPHQFSGGMRQRAAIAMALSLNPKLVILDEPTTALDVVVQKQILTLLRHLQREYRTSFIFITHDLSVLADIATTIAVMYAGKLAEIGSETEVLRFAPASLQQGAHRGDPEDRRGQDLLEVYPRSPARPYLSALGLQVPSALPVRVREVPQGRAGADPDKQGDQSRMPSAEGLEGFLRA